TSGIGCGADQKAVAGSRGGDDPAIDELVVNHVRLNWPRHARSSRLAPLRWNWVQPGVTNEFCQGRGLQQVAVVAVSPYVLPCYLHHLLPVDGCIHIWKTAMAHPGLADGQAGAPIAFERVHDRLRRCRRAREPQANRDE